MHCLVTGASGYIGAALVEALLQRGCEVTAHRGRRAPECADPRLRELHGEIEDIELADLSGVDCVMHLAAIAHQGATPEDYQRVNVDAALTLARRALAAGVPRFVFFSSVKAVPSQGAVRSDLDYGQSKAEAERLLAALCQEQPLELVLIRPALVFGGSEKGHLRLLERWVRWHLPRPPAGGARSLIARSDVVALALRVLDTEAGMAPRLITLTDGEAYTTRRLHRALCRRWQRRPWLPSPPAFLWRAGADLLDRLRSQPPGSTWRRLAGQELYVPQGLEALNFTPAACFESVLGVEDDSRNGPHSSAEPGAQ